MKSVMVQNRTEEARSRDGRQQVLSRRASPVARQGNYSPIRR